MQRGGYRTHRQKITAKCLTKRRSGAIVSYTSNEPINHVWKGGERLPPTLNEQTSIYLQIAKMLEDYAVNVVNINASAEFNRHPAATAPDIPYDLVTLLYIDLVDSTIHS